jgi:hypothetical protein
MTQQATKRTSTIKDLKVRDAQAVKGGLACCNGKHIPSGTITV